MREIIFSFQGSSKICFTQHLKLGINQCYHWDVYNRTPSTCAVTYGRIFSSLIVPSCIHANIRKNIFKRKSNSFWTVFFSSLVRLAVTLKCLFWNQDKVAAIWTNTRSPASWNWLGSLCISLSLMAPSLNTFQTEREKERTPSSKWWEGKKCNERHFGTHQKKRKKRWRTKQHFYANVFSHHLLLRLSFALFFLCTSISHFLQWTIPLQMIPSFDFHLNKAHMYEAH